GVAVNAIAGAGTGVLTYVANDEQLRSLTFWSMGSLAYASWEDLSLVAPWLLGGVFLLQVLARPLNAFLLGGDCRPLGLCHSASEAPGGVTGHSNGGSGGGGGRTD